MQETIRESLQLFFIQGSNLAHSETKLSRGKDLKILIKNLFIRLLFQIGCGGEHLHSILFDLHSGNLRQLSSRFFIHRRTSRGAEKQRIGNDGGHQKSRRLFVNRNIVFLINLINDGTATAKRLIPKVYGRERLNRSQTMMVNNLQNLRAFHPRKCLSELIMIHHNDLLSSRAEQISAGNHPEVLSFFTENREISVSLTRHHFPDIIDIILLLDSDDALFRHKEINRNRLVNQSCRGVRIIGSHHDDHPVMLCEIADSRGCIGSFTDDDTVRSVIQCG